MNIIHILLIAGLVYFALQQKQESSRNTILIVTGLLAICMMRKEGFDLAEDATSQTLTGWPGLVTNASPLHTIVGASGESFVFHFPDRSNTITLDGNGQPWANDVITCTKNGDNGNVSYKTGVTDWVTPTGDVDISDYLACTAAAGAVTTCADVNTPPGCTPATCTTSLSQPYTGCTPAVCTATNTPHPGCTTTRTGSLCGENENVVGNACVACATGLTNVAGDDASGSPTSCDGTGSPPPPTDSGTPPPPADAATPCTAACCASMVDEDACGDDWSDWTWFAANSHSGTVCSPGWWNTYCKN